ncbi:MAG: ISAzo13 family transposase [Deltaproteobacteria bacterium]|nr:ISAzo13 family transposase [Deltaproteobacteria bacterium]
MIDIPIFFEALRPNLNEKTRRLVAAALTVGGNRGTTSQVSRWTGVSFREIRRGHMELKGSPLKSSGFRAKGGGRKTTQETNPGITEALKSSVDFTTEGDPESPLLWACKSLRMLAQELNAQGFKISYHTVGTLLEELGYCLQANQKVLKGSSLPDRHAQFEFINRRTKAFMRINQPIISVDCKKYDLIDNYKNNGRKYAMKGNLTNVKDYDITGSKGFATVGITRDTSIFAVQSIRNWWHSIGKNSYSDAKRLLITAHCGGSNGCRRKLWIIELAKFAAEADLKTAVCHFPVGTSKWNKIEHRLFSAITMSLRGRPLTRLEVIVNLISAAKNTTGSAVKCEIDSNEYQHGIKASDGEEDNMRIKKAKFHGDWNYTILP